MLTTRTPLAHLVVGAALGALCAGAAGAQTIQLPVEAISATVATETRALPLRDLAAAEQVYVRIHGLDYEGQASIRLNGGPWFDVDDRYIIRDDAQYGGIGGGFHTLRFRIPIGEFGSFDPRAPDPRIDFRYNGTDPGGHVTGYRVIALNLFGADGDALLPREAFAYDNPAAWEAPLAGRDAVDAGRDLWFNASLVDQVGGNEIRATCGDCHAKGGEDLEYFAYSNRSIIERSKFHGLSQREAEQVASYIRSHAGNTVEARRGRPYNPPYQPGTSLRDKSVDHWAAGAGLREVGRDEAATLAAFLEGGTSPEAIAARVDPDAAIDMTTIPIGIQLPDWNEWLPEVHPKDVWQGTHFDDSRANEHYESFSAELAGDPEATFRAGNFTWRLGQLQQLSRAFIADGRDDGGVNGGSQWRTQSSNATKRIRGRYKPGGSAEYAKEQLAKWTAVKFWEMIKLNGLEDRARDKYPGADRWQWPLNRQTVHQVAPHIIADNINNLAGRDPLAEEYASSAWYQLQLTINSGQGLDDEHGLTVEPVDWPYQVRHIWELAERTPAKRYEGMRYYLTLAKMYQVTSNGNGPYQWQRLGGRELKPGFVMRFVHPVFIAAMTKRGQFDLMDVPDAYEPGLSGRLQSALLATWLEVANRYPEEMWLRQTEPSGAFSPYRWDKLEPRDRVPSMDIPNIPRNAFFSTGRMNHVDHLYRLVDLLESRPGIDCGVIRGLAEWGEARWPNGDWVERLADPDCEAPAPPEPTPEPDPEPTPEPEPTPDPEPTPRPVTYTAPLAASVDGDQVALTWATAAEEDHEGFDLQRRRGNGRWRSIAWVPSRGESTAYRYFDRELDPGTYRYRLVQHQLDGDALRSQPVTAVVEAPDEETSDDTYAYIDGETLHLVNLPANAVVKLFNANGRELGSFPPGKTERRFNLANVPAGMIYVYWQGPGGRGNLRVLRP